MFFCKPLHQINTYFREICLLHFTLCRSFHFGQQHDVFIGIIFFCLPKKVFEQLNNSAPGLYHLSLRIRIYTIGISGGVFDKYWTWNHCQIKVAQITVCVCQCWNLMQIQEVIKKNILENIYIHCSLYVVMILWKKSTFCAMFLFPFGRALIS